jgi:UDP-2-acetamido-2-deoxy-ribo-hexuluronate aminotransferase
MEFIDLKEQYKLIKEDVLKEINEVLDSGQYILGEKVRELEHKLAAFTGSKYCIGVADGSKAILIALLALDIAPGDEIIVPSFTFIATATMVALIGAIPIFVDADSKTFNIDPNLIEKAITKRTRAIIPVSLYGQCANFEAINAIASKYNLKVIEDAAQSFGATRNKEYSCNLTTIGCTSFFPSKPLGGYGDGGACFTNDEELALKMRAIRIHGQTRRYHHAYLGVNGRLDTLQAAILLAKLKVFNQEIEARIKIGERYSSLLQNINNCAIPFVEPTNTHIYGQYTIIVENRDTLRDKLKEKEIPTAIHYPLPLHLQPALAKFAKNQIYSTFPNSEYAANHVLSLPMHPYLEESTQDYIVDIIKKNLA